MNILNHTITTTVSDPQVEQEGPNAYTSYRVHTVSTHPTFQRPEFTVRRRYTDFVFLHSTLVAEYPACAIPPVADKSTLANRFDTEFTQRRAASLQIFLERLSQHPFLKKADPYHRFLESGEWNAFKKSIASKELKYDLEAQAAEVDSKDLPYDESGLVEVREKLGVLEDNLSRVEKGYSKVLKKEVDLATDLESFAEKIMRLSIVEPGIQQELAYFADANRELSGDMLNLRDLTDTQYLTSLQDLNLYAGVLKSLLKLRDHKIHAQESLLNQLAKAEHDQASGGSPNFLINKIENVTGVNPESARQERLRKLKVKIASLKEQSDDGEAELAAFKKLSLNEIQIFEDIKKAEMKTKLKELATNNIDFYENLLRKWEKLIL